MLQVNNNEEIIQSQSKQLHEREVANGYQCISPNSGSPIGTTNNIQSLEKRVMVSVSSSCGEGDQTTQSTFTCIETRGFAA